MKLKPIEIVGGGLAGLALGLALRREEIPVTLFEAGGYPRHRVCGEFIGGLDEATIAGLRLEPFLRKALRHRRVAWFHGARLVRRQTLPEPAFGLSRFRLDASLAEAFRQAGGVLCEGRRIAWPERAKEGRILSTGRQAGRSPWIGLKVHAARLELAADLEVHLGEGGYVGLAPVEDGAVNLCGYFRQARAGMDSERRALPSGQVRGRGVSLLLGRLEDCGLGDVSERLRAAGLDDASFCAVAGLRVAGRVHADGALRIGDACGMIAPFTGNGMAMAFQSAEMSASFVAAYARGAMSWARARANAEAAERRRFRVRLASADALHPFLLLSGRQRWFAAASRARLLPLRPLYALLH
ncbi:MAG: NAD(P)/FAD-dependent oxidoreductase [Opitutaceae bacterium]